MDDLMVIVFVPANHSAWLFELGDLLLALTRTDLLIDFNLFCLSIHTNESSWWHKSLLNFDSSAKLTGTKTEMLLHQNGRSTRRWPFKTWFLADEWNNCTDLTHYFQSINSSWIHLCLPLLLQKLCIFVEVIFCSRAVVLFNVLVMIRFVLFHAQLAVNKMELSLRIQSDADRVDIASCTKQERREVRFTSHSILQLFEQLILHYFTSSDSIWGSVNVQDR